MLYFKIWFRSSFYLIIENNDILNYIGDVKCPSLEEFMVKGNNRLHSVQVENSKTLKKLVLRDLLSQDDVSLNDLDLPSLIELTTKCGIYKLTIESREVGLRG